MTFTCGPDSSPRRRASVVSGNTLNASAVSRVATASPTPVPVLAAIHEAAERCPSSRHAVPWLARRVNRTLPAVPSRSISANSAMHLDRLGRGDPVGVGVGEMAGDLPAGLLQVGEHTCSVA